jgi:site-specific DNA-methyltransferase (adenine-specific)
VKPYYDEGGIVIYHGDCRAHLDMWECRAGKAFDLLLTDPPYGINADRDRHSQADGWVDYGSSGWDREKASSETLAAYRGICRKSIVWGGNYFKLPNRMGWLVWDKGQREFSLADGELAWTSEDKALRIFSYPRGRQVAREQRAHPTQKPVELMLWCLSLFRDEKTVIDPFMGSGTTLVAAKQLGRQATGIEAEERYCEIAAERLRQGALFGAEVSA